MFKVPPKNVSNARLKSFLNNDTRSILPNNSLDSFDNNSIRDDGSGIIRSDGYLELEYGLIIPEEYKTNFVFAEKLSSDTLLPEISVEGYAYLVINNSGDRGLFYIWNNGAYTSFIPQYGWKLGSESVTGNTNFVTDFTSPDSFNNDIDGGITYREFLYINGIRIVVTTMNKFDSTFDLIEMSPRLVVDISNKVIDFNI